MRIAHVTDLHLRHHQPGTAAVNIRRSRQMSQRLREVLQQVRQQEVDLLAITGDLLDAPTWLWRPTPGFTVDDPALWRASVKQDYELVKRELDASELRYVVLPGNHDWDDVFWEVFDPQDNLFDLGDYRIVRFTDREVEGHFARRFTENRVRFNAMLQDDSNKPQIHLQHYLIHPTMHQGYPHAYRECEDMARRMSASGKVALSLSGHYHRGTELLKLGGTTFTTGPAFCEHPHPWRVYELSGDPQQPDITLTTHMLLDAPPDVRKVVYLDRDGVINDRASYRSGPEHMKLIPRAGAAIRRLKEAGWAVVVITSQSAIGAGYVNEDVVVSVHDRMHRLLRDFKAGVDGVYFSVGAGNQAVLPQYEDVSQGKPNPHHLHQAADQLHLDLSDAWMVGDSLTDIQAARGAGARPILVRTGNGERTQTHHVDDLSDVPVVDDLSAAADLILSQS